MFDCHCAILFRTSLNFSMPTPFSKNPFEFTTGFRRTLLIFPLAYALTVIAINVDNLNLRHILNTADFPYSIELLFET